MKKIIVLIGFLMLASASFGQLIAPKGLYVGRGITAVSGTNIAKIDSVTYNSTTKQFFMYKGADTANVYTPVANMIDGSTVYYPLQADTVNKTANFAVSATEVAKDVHCWKATSIVITISQNLSDWPVGKSINFWGMLEKMVFKASGVTFIADTASTTTCATSGKGQAVTVRKVATNKYMFIGPISN